jgi:hypothetical protein
LLTRRKLGNNETADVASSSIEVAIAREFRHDPAGAEALLRQTFVIRSQNLYAGQSLIMDLLRNSRRRGSL